MTMWRRSGSSSRTEHCTGTPRRRQKRWPFGRSAPANLSLQMSNIIRLFDAVLQDFPYHTPLTEAPDGSGLSIWQERYGPQHIFADVTTACSKVAARQKFLQFALADLRKPLSRGSESIDNAQEQGYHLCHTPCPQTEVSAQAAPPSAVFATLAE